MQIVLTAGGLSREFGGPSRSIPGLASALSEEQIDVCLITCRPLSGHTSPELPANDRVSSLLLPVRARRRDWAARRNGLFRAICKLPDSSQTVIHDNGLWLPSNHAVARASRILRRPFLISPRGMLSAQALSHHGLRKKVAWRLFQQRDFLGASAIHVTSEAELNDVRRAGYAGPTAVIPNGVNLPSRISSRFASEESRTALCVSRLHPIKGLLNLIEAWQLNRPKGWRLTIVGNSEDGHEDELKEAVSKHKLKGVVDFFGPANEVDKENLYRTSDLFILPSLSENFGISIAEALAHSLPVITTRATPWSELVSHHCGWWIDTGVAPLVRALREATNCDTDTLRRMGEKGRRLVEERYSWSEVGRKMKALYEWILDPRQPPPATVQMHA